MDPGIITGCAERYDFSWLSSRQVFFAYIYQWRLHRGILQLISVDQSLAVRIGCRWSSLKVSDEQTTGDLRRRCRSCI